MTVDFDVVIIGAGPAGIGIAAMLKDLGINRMVVLERENCLYFDKWPKEMQFITPSFTTNFYGNLDLNAVISGTSPAYTLRKEHPSGKEYAQYLRGISRHFELPITEYTNVEGVTYSQSHFIIHITEGKQ